MDKEPLDLSLGAVLTLKKAHPCGSNQWLVVRLGADIGLKCQGCGRRFLMSRRQLASRLKSISPGPTVPD